MADLSDQAFDLIQTVDKKIKNRSNKSIQELGLTAQQGKLIKYIYQHKTQHLIQKDLAEYFNKTTASMGSMLKILEREGYINRFIPEDNNRQKEIEVLQKGEKVIKQFDAKMDTLRKKRMQLLTTKEFEELSMLLGKLDEKL